MHRKLMESEKKMRRGKEDKGSCLVKRRGLSGSVTITLNITEKERGGGEKIKRERRDSNRAYSIAPRFVRTFLFFGSCDRLSPSRSFPHSFASLFLSASRHQLRSTSNSRANKNLIGRFLRSLLRLQQKWEREKMRGRNDEPGGLVRR